MAVSQDGAKDEPQHTWDEVRQQGLAEFAERERADLSKLLRQGVPGDLRWQVWKCLLQIDPAAVAPQVPNREGPSSDQIAIDLPRTFPEEPSFDAAKRQQLGRILNAYAVSEPSTGYLQSMNFVAGLLLVVSGDEAESLQVFEALLRGDRLGGLYAQGFPLLLRHCWASLRRVRLTLPDLHEHFRRIHYRSAQYIWPWFLTLFVKLLPIRSVLYFWDLILLEGVEAMVTLGVLVLQALEPILLFLDDADTGRLFELIRESGKGATAVAGRAAPAPRGAERFWHQLIQRRILRSFDAEHREVRQLLRQAPTREYTVSDLDEESARPSRSEMADFMPRLEGEFLSDPSEASATPSFLALKRLTDPFRELSTDARYSVSSAMQRLHNILDEPGTRRRRCRLPAPAP